MKTAGVICFILFTGFALSAQNFKASKQKEVDLKKYETFTIVQGEIIADQDKPVNRENFFSEFKKIVIREMEDRGYTYIDDSTAQLSISYVVETSRVIDTENVGPLGQMPQSNAGDQQTQHWSREFTRGTLIVSVEAGKGNAVWSAEGTMDVGRAQGVGILEYSIKNAFREFPEKKKVKRTKKG